MHGQNLILGPLSLTFGFRVIFTNSFNSPVNSDLALSSQLYLFVLENLYCSSVFLQGWFCCKSAQDAV